MIWLYVWVCILFQIFFFSSLFQSQLPTHHHQHRHSLTSRKVHRTRSSGATHHIFDDPMIEVCTQCQLITFSIYYSKPFARQTKLCISSTWIIILYWLTTISCEASYRWGISDVTSKANAIWALIGCEYWNNYHINGRSGEHTESSYVAFNV